MVTFRRDSDSLFVAVVAAEGALFVVVDEPLSLLDLFSFEVAAKNIKTDAKFSGTNIKLNCKATIDTKILILLLFDRAD